MRKMSIVLGIFVALLAGLSGCATAKSAEADSVQVPLSVALLSEKEVKDAYRWSLLDNPYLSFSGTVFPKTSDFLVFRLTANYPTATQLELLHAAAENADGKVKAPFYNSDRFKQVTMASVETQQSSGSFTQRENKITWNYLPEGALTLKPGQAFLYLRPGREASSSRFAYCPYSAQRKR